MWINEEVILISFKYICTAKVKMMADNSNLEVPKHDVNYNWISTSRFIFYVVIIALISYFVGLCFGLYHKRYKGKPDVEVPSNTLYNPTYKDVSK